MSKVEVRLKAKLTNAILEQFSDKMGGRQAAADALGICKSTFQIWVNFKGTFAISKGRKGGGVSKERARHIVLTLEKETGRNIRDIFPLTKEELADLTTELVEDKEVQKEALLNFSGIRQSAIGYEDRVVDVDLPVDISKTLKKLSYREREIIKLRYGLGVDSCSLEEVAEIFKVTRERVRQIEAKAMRKMQQPDIAHMLVGHLD